ncbi:hypothetical protein CO051_00520 [Candidatus Roizmanbacteria bacterium CG_4_9_14_0_2_um_filter_39_13]|uniref:EamA domain-containing protein n=1 Tax=Candidatus Roizmanbacteria bacterium CG_4_9_14_0_2_um_filter_39_13 TaxID=1974839 RepID=A0A2M8F406_9BACT|nr:MAG: hypothetical protein COY15_03790 [Candidatus Roizmanbacteria bacterium CG_4_10_14_0_2_um_filter_39_12]PJC34043.1 MAG: hypothetical protein CO051_00520 [Candidatus Roizmanbacteria bacterium CG_4_9_14_0_2_um_filter_39_13]
MNKTKIAPFFIMAAAALWAFDGLFRTTLTYTFSTTSIIFFEHVLGFLFLSPIIIKDFRWIKGFSSETWRTLLLMTLVSTVLGTLFFTEALARSFAFNDFVTPILIQKLQPVFVIIMSAIFLKEKLSIKFLVLALTALIGSYLVSFGTSSISLSLEGEELIYALALGAAFCWGTGTILSKKLLSKVDFPLATAMRFLLAIPISFAFAYVLHQAVDFSAIGSGDLSRFLIIAGITGGAGAIFLYYWGLQYTQAKISTFAELMFPVVAIGIAITPLNPYGTPQTLSGANIVGIIILIASIILISLENNSSKKPIHD